MKMLNHNLSTIHCNQVRIYMLEVILWLKTFECKYFKAPCIHEGDNFLANENCWKLTDINLYYKNNDLRLFLCLTSSTNWTYIFLKLKSGKLT